ncbi:MAG: hypothetical protein JXR36_11800 [Bacteroidales bacterium]|nr:hypothetical protein [Bacteroidales bacterium]
MNKKALDIELVEHFSGKESFSKKDIAMFYASTGLKLTDNALRWRIHRLKQQGVIMSVGRSVYSLETKPRFLQEPDEFTTKVVKLFKKKFDVDYCIWDTKTLHNFILHQPFRFFYILETDKDVTESAFYHLKDNNIKVFLNPSMKIMEEYVLGEDDVVLIKPLLSRPPLTANKKIAIPELEKVLVDIFCDQHQFFMFGGQEMIYIYENAINHYNINFTTLYAYADRRGKRETIENYISDKILG